MQKLRWLAILMGVTILGITGFQGYWLKNNYDREEQALELKTSAWFRQSLLKLQTSKMKLDKINLQFDERVPGPPGGIMVRPMRKNKSKDRGAVPGMKEPNREPPISMLNILQEKMKEYEADTSRKRTFIFSTNDSLIRLRGDSLAGLGGKGFNGRIKEITISSRDSLFNPQMIEEMRMNGELPMPGHPGAVVRINYEKSSEGKDDTTALRVKGYSHALNGVPPDVPMEDVFTQRANEGKEGNSIFRFLYTMDSLSIKDSVTVKEITGAYAARLKEEKANLEFAVTRIDSSQVDSTALSEVTIGFVNPITYRLSFQNKISYILKELKLPILFSILLVGITIASFVLLYRNLLRQRRLAEQKNQFISNITHELKTPIATVGVAIEALQNFNAIHDPQRTKEYLDISQSELQRLNMLVDKVLKLSMFEKKELELKKEQFDCRQLVEEVMKSMKLQFEKYHAKVKLHTSGDNFIIDADKLHITSVVYNLLDNALKYSKEDPTIDVELSSHPEYIELSVADNGIGIEPAYQQKIFDKFFRVPTGDKHNIKGYGLGLSYVAEVIKRHQGHVYAQSELGRGSTFVAKMPYTVS
jgi:two-component system phosphate regulon sensor histidine kinase PhoR